MGLRHFGPVAAEDRPLETVIDKPNFGISASAARRIAALTATEAGTERFTTPPGPADSGDRRALAVTVEALSAPSVIMLLTGGAVASIG